MRLAPSALAVILIGIAEKDGALGVANVRFPCGARIDRVDHPALGRGQARARALGRDEAADLVEPGQIGQSVLPGRSRTAGGARRYYLVGRACKTRRSTAI